MKISFNKKLFSFVIPLAGLSALVALPFLPVRKSLAKEDWQHKMPTDLVKVRSAMPNNVFMQGQPVVLEIEGTAVRFVVRDYWGEIVEEGNAERWATGRLHLKVSTPGWYKLYLFGPRERAPWGWDVGGTTFCIFREDARFPSITPLKVSSEDGLANMGALKVSTTVPQIDFNWKEGAPQGVRSDNFRARWSGWIRPRLSETYTFTTRSDDGVRLWVNGVKIIDNWTIHGATDDSASVDLVAGTKYDIRMEFFEQAHGAEARLFWSRPSTTRVVIPRTQLYPAVATPTAATSMKMATTASGATTVRRSPSPQPTPAAPSVFSTGAATVASGGVQLMFQVTLDARTALAPARYRVEVNGLLTNVESVTMSGNTVSLRLPSSILRRGARVKVTWSGLKDARGQSIANGVWQGLAS